MAVLTEKQIKYGFDYYHKDDARPKSVVEVSEYDGEDKLIINCIQPELPSRLYSLKAGDLSVLQVQKEEERIQLALSGMELYFYVAKSFPASFGYADFLLRI